jgi:hypothetical protein
MFARLARFMKKGPAMQRKNFAWATLPDDLQESRRDVLMSHACMVFFRAGTCDLEAAASSLRDQGLEVSQAPDLLVASSDGSPEFRIRLSNAPHVLAEAIEIGAGTPEEAAMRELDARFEVAIDDLDEALDEINTLIEVQAALQEVSNGYLFLSWNGHLSGPG